MQLRPAVKSAINQAIESGSQPKANRNGMGLILPIPGARHRVLYNEKGLTPMGTYYYQKTGIPPPGKFPYNQDAVRKGRSQYITLLDGSQKKISTWDNVNREWKLTKLGKSFYSKAVDRYTVLWPVRVDLTRINGSIFSREDWLPSSKIEAIGEIEVPRNLSDAEQRARVAQIELNWRSQQPIIEGERVLLPGYETHVLDLTDTRRVQYNKLSVSQQGDVEAVIHRPLREGNPWDFGLPGICEESLENTQGRCVTHQLSKYFRIHGQPQFSQEDLADMLTIIQEELYADDEDLRNPEIGFTAAAILELCKEISVPIHVKWGEHKIKSFLPEKEVFQSVCVYIWGDHCYTVGDEKVKRAIIREPTSEPTKSEECVLAKIGKITSTTTACQYWDTFSEIKPGHFYASDLLKVRGDMLRQHVSPKVYLSGLGNIKRLQYNDCIVHNWPAEAHICLRFLERYSEIRHHSLSYRGESLSTFCQMVFDDLCRPCDRPFLPRDVKTELAGRQKGLCNVCGDAIVQEIDHKIPRSCHGSDSMDNFAYLCSMCHKEKTKADHQRMNVEDQNAYMSRFNEETFAGFVNSRKPTQVVCNLHKQLPGLQCMEVDVRSCRLNGIVEANTEPIPIFSPLDEFESPRDGSVADYSWVDLGKVRSPLANYIYDGPRWYSAAEVKFMLTDGMCKWSHILLCFNATSHRPAGDLAAKLKKMKYIWEDVGGSFQAVMWAGSRAKKKDVKELLPKTALLSLLGAWGRVTNYRYSCCTTSHPDDIPWSSPITTRPTPFSEQTETGYVFSDITWVQEVLNLGSFLPLNLIGRSQERIKVATALAIVRRCTKLSHVLSIQVDAIYVQPVKKGVQEAPRRI